MTTLTLRPLRVWLAGHYWRWQCRVCGTMTKDLFPLAGQAYDDAVYHLEGHCAPEDGADD